MDLDIIGLFWYWISGGVVRIVMLSRGILVGLVGEVRVGGILVVRGVLVVLVKVGVGSALAPRTCA